ncbi:MAG: genomic island protein, partial [Gammaproteobacteria bacterium]|nr:genomic island protein [Gammaproteobacteria bacterium]
MATKYEKEYQLARAQWDRYTTAMSRGHTNYQIQAKKNEDFYFGGGYQWDEDVKQALEAIGKPWLEENIIFPTVNTVLGYQTQSRMDIAYKPREIGDQETSDILTKLTMFVVDQNRFPWLESQVFADGLIQQRGYFDVRMDFDENINGDISIRSLDPLDVIPDPDAKSYDPKDWSDVTVSNWVPLDDIKTQYGLAAWRKVAKHIENSGDPDFGGDELGVERNKFADEGSYNSYYTDSAGQEHVRLLERQWYKLTNREFFYDLESGDLNPVPDGLTAKEKNKIAKDNEYEIVKRTVRRVRWTVSTKDVVLHDAWSPYEFFTVVPFFPYFRRGRTTGMVDNLIKTQEMLNK